MGEAARSRHWVAVRRVRFEGAEMDELWMIRAEIEIEPGDLDLEPEYTKGFMNVITWGSSEESIRKRLSDYIGTFHWNLLSIDEACLVSNMKKSSTALDEMIERAKPNPMAIILGTFHTYREKT
jgi:hypothetical protein